MPLYIPDFYMIFWKGAELGEYTIFLGKESKESRTRKQTGNQGLDLFELWSLV